MEVAESPGDAESLWAPFHNEAEWELVHFLVKNIGHTRMDEFLKLDIVRQNGVSFENTCSLLKYVDKLCTGPAWTCEMIDVEGDIVAEDGTLKHEQLELWQHDPVECMQELMGNPAFWEVMSYVPERAYTDVKGENHIYDEMWTGDWWWNMQKKLPEGAVVAPVILSSDKTSLSQFSRDKKAWLVYLTIGNISKDVRHQVSAHATLLIGYLPVSKLKCFHKKTWSLAGYRLFHHAMSLLLHPLMDAGCQGREMVCADGYLRSVHPILAAYIADFPEQCLVACNKESRCPCCLVQSNKCGNLEDWASRNMADTLKTLQRMRRNKRLRKFDAEGLHAIFNPFWKELPFTDIFACLTPDILHQLHKGIFHDHLLQWCMSIVSEKEIDACFQAMTQYPALHHFKKGVSSVSQWTGTEHKEMQRVFVGLLAGAVDDHVLIVICSLLDFIYYVQLQQHTDTTLAAMKASLKTFHDHKHVLIELGVCEDFNMPKIHSLQHYVSSIQALGSADGYNTEYPERLHINYAKDGYCASNKRDYVEQMALWLQCQEAMHYKSAYLAWRRPCEHSDDDCLSAREKGVSGLPNGISPLMFYLSVKAHYKVAKTPPCRHLSIDCIESDYLAFEFLPALEQFLVSQLGQRRVIQPIRSDRFDVYNHLYVVTGPSIISGHGQSLQKIHASRRIAAHGCKAETPARSDTVFFYCTNHSLSGMQLAQVRVIFNLPDHFGSYPHPLAYVEWFTTLQQHDPVSGLYVISHSTRNHCHNVGVISVDRIIHPCHLLAWCGREISKDWTVDSVLEKASFFYVNSYIDLDMFLSLE
ncbi:hypothetical protein EDD16DRAFT_1491663 [Pisolithus croceorrhizus]|nr:hypothetical protein EV401DRAFT_1880636 [Pisolithus croceorrhizus]KAI6105243.1 hypothetical protein EDD16DRAFT_1491663 [Pisolithus croceorrhizus]KAI6169198.1 hypothetical protein EDD17DRAFT_1465054 [Pisolithus thermaeus]